MISNLINFLTLLRIFFALAISLLLILKDGYIYALILFIFAGLSDFFDGYFARKYDATSQIGEILDPVADKILIIFILFSLCVNLSSFLIAFSASLMISREIWISALRDFSARNGISEVTKVTFLAKIKTSIQLFTIFLYLLALSINNMIIIIFADIFIIMSVLITIYTGLEYTMKVFKAK